MTRHGLPPLERLMLHSIEQPDGCLIWTGSVNEKGYGRAKYRDGRNEYVHRIAWRELRGEIPPETPDVLHRCDTPPCWQIDHLYVGTEVENHADMTERRRHGKLRKDHCPHGHPFDGVRKSDGARTCSTCMNAASARWRARRAR